MRGVGRLRVVLGRSRHVRADAVDEPKALPGAPRGAHASAGVRALRPRGCARGRPSTSSSLFMNYSYSGEKVELALRNKIRVAVGVRRLCRSATLTQRSMSLAS